MNIQDIPYVGETILIFVAAIWIGLFVLDLTQPRRIRRAMQQIGDFRKDYLLERGLESINLVLPSRMKMGTHPRIAFFGHIHGKPFAIADYIVGKVSVVYLITKFDIGNNALFFTRNTWDRLDGPAPPLSTVKDSRDSPGWPGFVIKSIDHDFARNVVSPELIPALERLLFGRDYLLIMGGVAQCMVFAGIKPRYVEKWFQDFQETLVILNKTK